MTVLRNEDALNLIRQTASLETIIVGGQAVTIWGLYYGVLPRSVALSGDIDGKNRPDLATFLEKRLPQLRRLIEKSEAKYQKLLTRRADLAARKSR